MVYSEPPHGNTNFFLKLVELDDILFFIYALQSLYSTSLRSGFALPPVWSDSS